MFKLLETSAQCRLFRVSLSNTRLVGPDYEHIMRRMPPSWALDPAMLCIDLPNK